MSQELSEISIAVDAMGGDKGVKITIPALLRASDLYPNIKFICIGDEKKIKPLLTSNKNIEVIHTDEEISMNDTPSFAVRNKKKSSMRQAIDLVKNNSAHACVSSGNTGALMAISHFRLKMLEGISRPAIMSALPTYKDNVSVRVLDLGANVAANAKILQEFAIIGSATASAEGVKNPKVGLLNVGQEQHKGHAEIKEADKLLKATKGINYCGFAEGNQVFSGDLDVIVCDGFVGNILLKSCEGLISSVGKSIKKNCKKNPLKMLSALIAKYSFKNVIDNYHPDRHNGAVLAGLNGIVVKSHGGAGIRAFESAIYRAIVLAKGKSIDKKVAKILATNRDLTCIQD